MLKGIRTWLPSLAWLVAVIFMTLLSYNQKNLAEELKRVEQKEPIVFSTGYDSYKFAELEAKLDGLRLRVNEIDNDCPPVILQRR